MGQRRIQVLLGGIIYYTAVLLFFYPFQNCTNAPVAKVDYGYHYFNALNAKEHLWHHGSTLGYNTYFGTGIIEADSPSGRFFLPIGVFSNSAFVYNCMILVILVLLPLLFAWSVSPFVAKEKRYFTFLGAIFLVLNIAIFRDFVRVGHLGFLVGTALSFLAIRFLWQIRQKLIKADAARMIFFLIAAIYFHITSSIVFWFFLFALMFESLGWRQKIKLTLISVLSFSVLAISYLSRTYIHFVQRHSFAHVKELSVYLQPRNATDLKYYCVEMGTICLMILFIYWLVKYARVKEQIVARRTWKITLLLLGLFIFAGGFSFLDALQPLRFLIVVFWILIVLLTWLPLRGLNAILGIFLVITSINVVIGRIPIINGCGDSSLGEWPQMKSKIIANMSQRSRLHIQQSRANLRYGTRLTSFVPGECRIPTLSYPLPYPAAHHLFIDNRLFGKEINEIGPEKLAYYSNIYNVSHYLVASKEAKERFSSFPNLEFIYEDSEYQFYRLKDAVYSYCHNCTADVTFWPDVIRVKNVSGKRIILKFSYFKELKIFPTNLEIKPYIIEKGIHPFIEIINGEGGDFEIHYKKVMQSTRGDE